jgi:hypothetical protein
MIAHDRIGKHIQPKHRRQRFHPSPNPLFAKREIFTGHLIHSRQESPPHTSLHGMHDANITANELFITVRSKHQAISRARELLRNLPERPQMSIDWWVAPSANHCSILALSESH